MWGVIPAAGVGSRMQPLAFSKELLPVGSRQDGPSERPRAVSEYLLDRMLCAGASRICFVISAGKHDIIEYYGGAYEGAAGRAQLCYVVQQRPEGLCDSIFHALAVLRDDDEVVVGLPDTIWFPEDGLRELPAGQFSFLLFPVTEPEWFDAVVTREDGRVREVQVKRPDASTRWVWGAFRLSGRHLRELHALWSEPGRADTYVGTLVNEYVARGGDVRGVRAGDAYVDVGTLHGYRQAIRLLASRGEGRPGPRAEDRDARGEPDLRRHSFL
ncbi:MAG TPA: sugar phosphate nucleotidyltransferase [Longimicrobiales bacterium]|nr:sugar phosphate nucleotidyltransferase [Longimicrobiales bacterium]